MCFRCPLRCVSYLWRFDFTIPQNADPIFKVRMCLMYVGVGSSGILKCTTLDSFRPDVLAYCLLSTCMCNAVVYGGNSPLSMQDDSKFISYVYSTGQQGPQPGNGLPRRHLRPIGCVKACFSFPSRVEKQSFTAVGHIHSSPVVTLCNEFMQASARAT